MPQEYLLNRDLDESKRLTAQHHVWVKSYGYLVHPQAASSLPKAPTIADIGTGTGIWITHAAREYGPDGEYHGFDLSADQFPPSDALPGNVKLRGGINMKHPFPSEFHNKFDVVHVRCLLLAMEPDDWRKGVDNLCTLLKPGGYLQWEEADINHIKNVMRSTPEAEVANLRAGFERMDQMLKHRTRPVPDIFVEAFKNASCMHDVIHDTVSSDRLPETRRQATEAEIGCFEGVSKQAYMDDHKDAWSAEKSLKLAQDMRADADSGGYINFWMHCMVGRK